MPSFWCYISRKTFRHISGKVPYRRRIHSSKQTYLAMKMWLLFGLLGTELKREFCLKTNMQFFKFITSLPAVYYIEIVSFIPKRHRLRVCSINCIIASNFYNSSKYEYYVYHAVKSKTLVRYFQEIVNRIRIVPGIFRTKNWMIIDANMICNQSLWFYLRMWSVQINKYMVVSWKYIHKSRLSSQDLITLWSVVNYVWVLKHK